MNQYTCGKCGSRIARKMHVDEAGSIHYEWHCSKCGIVIGTSKTKAEMAAMGEEDYYGWIDAKDGQFATALLKRGKIKEVQGE
jgi:transcription elongation factor Elf1